MGLNVSCNQIMFVQANTQKKNTLKHQTKTISREENNKKKDRGIEIRTK